MIAEDQNILFPRKYLDGTEHGASRVIYYILCAKKFQQLLCDWSLVDGCPSNISKQCVNNFD